MTQRDPADLAQRFLDKALQDEVLIRKVIDDPEVADEQIGFHAQQAIEKMLKAVGARHGLALPRIHGIADLIGRLEDAGLDMPDWLTEAVDLVPYAVAGRYPDYESDESLDRTKALDLVRRTREWGEQEIQGKA